MDTKEMRDLASRAMLTALLGAEGARVFVRLVDNTRSAMSAAHADGYGQGFRDGVDSAQTAPSEQPAPVWKGDEVIDWTQARIRSNDEIGSAPRDEDNILEDCCRGVLGPYKY